MLADARSFADRSSRGDRAALALTSRGPRGADARPSPGLRHVPRYGPVAPKHCKGGSKP